MFYVIAPFLGGLAGCLGMIGIDTTVGHFLSIVALGTLATTFLVWVIVDPVVGLMEMLLPPTSRKHRAERLAAARVQRQERQREREHLLAEVLAKEEANVRRWQDVLKPQAEKLAALLISGEADFENAERQAADIGVTAWQTGGLVCMRALRNMAIEISRQNNPGKTIVDYVTIWWDGIGSWRSPSLLEMANS
jgi:hypothetical protein